VFPRTLIAQDPLDDADGRMRLEQSSKPSTGFVMSKPFYLIGHNTNSIDDVKRGLAAGLNAFEVDVNCDENNVLYISHDPVHTGALSAAHDPQHLPPRVVPFLVELKKIADAADGRLALLILDCKIDDPALALPLLGDVRTYFSEQGTTQRVIFSVPTVGHAERFFATIQARLSEREGLMIDEEADVTRVDQFFRKHNVARGGYGNGLTTVLGVGLPSPQLVSQMDTAVALSALGGPTFVYPWVLARQTTMHQHLAIGVSGAMVDVAQSNDLVQVVQRAGLPTARVTDDPFAPLAVIVLKVVTADVSHAGTDATLSLTLTASDGATYTKQVDGAYSSRFERGQATWITLWDCSFALSQVSTIAVSHDGSGNAPDWSLESITLSERGGASKTVTFDAVIMAGPGVRKAV
jgi:hypothetical protein